MKCFNHNGTEYQIYLAASGDHCVEVSAYGKDVEHYNCGSEEDALLFILNDICGGYDE